MPITAVKIFPSIGIARLGNSPDHFLGPEIPGDRTPPLGGYRDSHCRVRRQAARFRLFAYDGPALVGEITMADAAITWTVHLANKKASWKEFNGPSEAEPLRNASFGAGERWKLEIDPGAASLNGPNQAAGFNTGHFLGEVVPLGEMRTDAQGRLLVLGGFGSSSSVPPGKLITHYANNDGWHDDVSDGPVTASVTINGDTFQAAPAWVICPPPDFAPPLDSVTTLYDVLFDIAVKNFGYTIPAKPSFTNDILPILERVFNMARVSQFPASSHFDFSGAAAAAMSASRRQDVFDRLRKPKGLPGPAGGNMPLLRGDNYTADLTVSQSQYLILQKWTGVEGTDWVNDWPTMPPPGTITPDGLTRAALEACVGGAFFPGIEASWFVRDKFAYAEPFRLDAAALSPGDVTKQMAVPWQADFYECQLDAGIPWWPAQRPDDVYPEGGGGPVKWIRDLIMPGSGHEHEDMVENWHKLGFIVEKSGQFVETDRRPVCTNLFFVNDRSHFSEDEVASALDSGSPAPFDDSFYVIAEGFLPAELGVTKKDPTPAELAPIAPAIEIRRADDTLVPKMSASARQLLLEDDTLPAGLRQRFTFVYRVEFTGTDAFDVESQQVKVLATKGSFSTEGSLTLFKQPNPFMKDGPTSWLSIDTRVFKVNEGDVNPFGFPVGTVGNDEDAALDVIDKVVNHFNTLGPANHPFDKKLTADQEGSWLELSEKVGTKRVFNFAVARVRYRGKLLDAPDVSVFFRLFTTAATGLDYNPSSTYRRTPAPVKPIARLGLQAGKVVTIPCFGRKRKDTAVDSMDTQTDDLNVHTFPPTGSGEDEHYFGCWLDFNQTKKRFPQKPVPAEGPWPPADQKSIQDLVRGLHQCLVAEVYFDKDKIGLGASPASSDNLAQRNLAIVQSDNPGSLATHTVSHTFEIKATHPAPQLLTATITNIPGTASVLPAGPDELMIRWRDLPRSTHLTLYMPDLNADDVLRLAGQSYSSVRLEKVDDHTLRCLPGDVSFIPLPPGRNRDIAGLLTLELPAEVRRGQLFQIVVQQISGRPRSVLGAFQLSIPVSDKAVLLEPEVRNLSVLRHIALSIEQDDPWHPVFVRWLDQIADRVRGFGGDPDAVAPSPDGSGRRPARKPWKKDWLKWKKGWKEEWKKKKEK